MKRITRLMIEQYPKNEYVSTAVQLIADYFFMSPENVTPMIEFKYNEKTYAVFAGNHDKINVDLQLHFLEYRPDYPEPWETVVDDELEQELENYLTEDV